MAKVELFLLRPCLNDKKRSRSSHLSEDFPVAQEVDDVFRNAGVFQRMVDDDLFIEIVSLIYDYSSSARAALRSSRWIDAMFSMEVPSGSFVRIKVRTAAICSSRPGSGSRG